MTLEEFWNRALLTFDQTISVFMLGGSKLGYLAVLKYDAEPDPNKVLWTLNVESFSWLGNSLVVMVRNA